VIVVSILLYAFLYLPLAIIVTQSFNADRYGTRWSGFTLGWYRAMFSSVEIRSALKMTAILAVSSTAISTLIGSLLGYGLARHRFPGKPFLSQMLLLPIAVPDIVMAVSLLLFYALVRSWFGIFNLGLLTMIIAHVTFQIPFVALIVRARLNGVDPSIEEAARDLGASRWQRLWHVTLPLLRPGIVGGALLAFTLSLDDFVVSFFTSGAGSATVPIYIYGSVKRGFTGEIHALSTLLIAAAILSAAGVAWSGKRARSTEE
jgi:spermidine/putrescine transport system permease protein